MIRIGNFTISEFKEQAKEKSVICFCAGQKFRELCDRYQLASNILYVVDNYMEEKILDITGVNIPVRRMEETGEEMEHCLLLLTSIKNVKEIIGQLDQNVLCDNLLFYVPELFGTEPDAAEIPEGMPRRIPKRIHYCWFGGEQMPKAYRRNLETWQEYCPDYEIIRWDESNYDVTKNLYMRQAYEAKMWGFVSDYVRIDVVNKYGGVYLDTDVELLRPLDSLLQYSMFCGFESPRYVNFGLGFGAITGHFVLKELLAEYENIEFCQQDKGKQPTPCPVYQTRVLERYGLERNGATQIKDYFTVLSTEYLCPLNQYGVGKPSTSSFSIHQYAASWLDAQHREKEGRMAENYRFVADRIARELGTECMKLPWGCP